MSEWKLVPVEPTPEMMRAGCVVPLNKAARHNVVWRAMLDAAPAPDVQPVAELVEHDVFNGVVKGFKTLSDLPVGTRFYTHPPAADVQELVEALRNILDNDGGEGSKCYSAIQLFDARQAAIEALAKWEGK